MVKYVVVAGPVDFDGDRYNDGDSIVVSGSSLKQLLELGVIEKVTDGKSKKEQVDAADSAAAADQSGADAQTDTADSSAA